ncbi:MAG: hypothetical protein PHS82_15285 [Lachnospiraceae bacterium]|nr:hypothetical protein [Lachnospiraceae bacterium]
MKNVGKVLRTIFWTVTVLAMLATVTMATYAWFTSNRTVTTDTATSRTGTGDLTLQISEQGGNAFTPVEEAAIVQVNQTAEENLLPVSTGDLQNFVYNGATVEGQARSFSRVDNEAYYYHGRIFLRAEAENMQEGARLALYLDQADAAGGAMVSTDSGDLLAAARLGLMFDEDAQSTVIFRLSDDYSSTGTAGNTFLNGTRLGDNEVLSWNGSGVSTVADPSVTLDQYTIQMDDTTVTRPKAPLLYMDFNQVYQVDIYFYVEGCDPDSAENVYHDGGNLHLAFYGMMA